MIRWVSLAGIALGASMITFAAIQSERRECEGVQNLTLAEMTALKGASDYYGVWAGASCSADNNGGDCVDNATCTKCAYNFPTTYAVFGIGSGIKPGTYFNSCGTRYVDGTCNGAGDPSIACEGAASDPSSFCAQENALNQTGGSGGL